MITVDPSGHNSIVIVPGANDLLSAEDVDRVKDGKEKSEMKEERNRNQRKKEIEAR
jgi:hypothetical protein